MHQPEVIVVDEPMVGLDPKERSLAQGSLPGVRPAGRHRAHEHPHAGGRRGDVRPHRDHPGRQDRRLRDDGGASPADRLGRHEPRGAVPEAHGRSSRRELGASSTAECGGDRLPCTRAPDGALAEVAHALARGSGNRRSGRPEKLLLLALLGRRLLDGGLPVCYRVLLYIRCAQEIGTILAAKMLGVILLAFASILLLSNLVTALSTFFLARDLDMLVAAPMDWLRLYLAKLLRDGGALFVDGGAAGASRSSRPTGSCTTVVPGSGSWRCGAFVPFLLLPCVIGGGDTLVLVNVFPARRTRDLLSLVAIGAMAIVVLTLRRPAARAAGTSRGIPATWSTSWARCRPRPARSCRASGRRTSS